MSVTRILSRVVEASGHHVALHDFVVGQGHLLETIESIRRGSVEGHLDIGQQSQAELPRVQPCEVPLDIAACLQAPDPLQRRRDSQIHFSRQLGNRSAAVLLEPCQKPAIDTIELLSPPGEDTGAVSFRRMVVELSL